MIRLLFESSSRRVSSSVAQQGFAHKVGGRVDWVDWVDGVHEVHNVHLVHKVHKAHPTADFMCLSNSAAQH